MASGAERGRRGSLKQAIVLDEEMHFSALSAIRLPEACAALQLTSKYLQRHGAGDLTRTVPPHAIRHRHEMPPVGELEIDDRVLVARTTALNGSRGAAAVEEIH